ncbi:MAG TPA: peptidylprolyl isomerase [Candidatus Eisenbacteria bacterium]
MKARTRAVLVLALLAATAAPAGAQRLDGIAAVVNDDPILESDVEEQVSLLLARAQSRPDTAFEDTLRRQVLDQLINNKLIVAEAKRQGISVSDVEVSRAVEQQIAQKTEELGGEEAFRSQLRRENTTEDRLRDKYASEIRLQMLGQRLLARQFPPKPVPPAEAIAFFQANPSRFPKAPAEVRVAVIQIPVTPDSVASAKGRAAALAARKRILGGEKFAKVAAEVSDDPNSARAGGDLGFFARGTMEPGIDAAAFSLKVGQMSDPVLTPFGWHILEVMERDTLKTGAGRDSLGRDGKPLLEAHARHILVRVALTDDDAERAKKLAERVRAQAVKGANFGTLVRRYSKYQGPQSEDGDLGFLSMASLSPPIRAGLDTLEVGEVSEVLSNQAGYNVFKLVDRKPEHAYALEEIKDELPDAVEQLRFKDKYEEWVKGLRAKAHIEYR